MRLSIVIPCYNSADTIEATLRSIQSCDCLDQIGTIHLVNDCSTDATVEIARATWVSNIPLNIYSFGKNKGQWSVTNFGISTLSEGSDWTFLLHADDVVKRNWLSLYIDAMQKAPESVGSICSSYDDWWGDSRIKAGEDCPGAMPVHVEGTRESVIGTINSGCWWHISGCAIRNQSFKEVGPFDPAYPMLGDWDWCLRLLAAGHGIWYVPRSTLLYRQIDTSVSGRSFRVAQDIRDRLAILQRNLNLGLLPMDDYNVHFRRTIRLLTRRFTVRLARRDRLGVTSHFSLMAEILKTHIMSGKF